MLGGSSDGEENSDLPPPEMKGMLRYRRIARDVWQLGRSYT
jgi:hypothetical protein